MQRKYRQGKGRGKFYKKCKDPVIATSIEVHLARSREIIALSPSA